MERRRLRQLAVPNIPPPPFPSILLFRADSTHAHRHVYRYILTDWLRLQCSLIIHGKKKKKIIQNRSWTLLSKNVQDTWWKRAWSERCGELAVRQMCACCKQLWFFFPLSPEKQMQLNLKMWPSHHCLSKNSPAALYRITSLQSRCEWFTHRMGHSEPLLLQVRRWTKHAVANYFFPHINLKYIK